MFWKFIRDVSGWNTTAGGFLYIRAPGGPASGFLWSACALRPAVREKKASEQTVFEILEMGRKERTDQKLKRKERRREQKGRQNERG